MCVSMQRRLMSVLTTSRERGEYWEKIKLQLNSSQEPKGIYRVNTDIIPSGYSFFFIENQWNHLKILKDNNKFQSF